MSDTPAGLSRFTRSMTTRYQGKCAFCGLTTMPGSDFAAMSQGKWIAVCRTCSVSIAAQVRGKVRMLQAASEGMDAAALAPIAAVLPSNDDLQLAMTDRSNEALAYDVILKLDAAMDVLASVKPAVANPMLDALRGVAANPQAQPRDREFAASLAAGLAKYGKLTDRQAPHADRLIARYADGGTASAPAPAAGEGLYYFDNGQVRKVYMTRNDRLACKVLHVHGDHATFEYEQGGRRIVADALAAGKAHLMTQDEAAAFGRQYSFCCNCAKYLDDDRSLAAGYGPTCAANNGWYYPTHTEAAAILQRPVGEPTPEPVTEPEQAPLFEVIGTVQTWICDNGGLHYVGDPCDCPADEDDE
jgi:hypothetical protein